MPLFEAIQKGAGAGAGAGAPKYQGLVGSDDKYSACH